MPHGNKDPETDEAWVAHSFFMPLRAYCNSSSWDTGEIEK